MKFENNLNLHDIAFAVAYCESREIEYNILEINVQRLIHSEGFMDLALRVKCNSPQIATHIWLMERMSGLPVFGCGEGCVIKKGDQWVMFETDRQLAMYNTEKECVPGFFRYTPEQIYSFLTSPVVKDLTEGRRTDWKTTQGCKLDIYRQWWPNLQSRPKFTGFEKIMDQDAKVRALLTYALPNNSKMHHLDYEELMASIYPPLKL